MQSQVLKTANSGFVSFCRNADQKAKCFMKSACRSNRLNFLSGKNGELFGEKFIGDTRLILLFLFLTGVRLEF